MWYSMSDRNVTENYCFKSENGLTLWSIYFKIQIVSLIFLIGVCSTSIARETPRVNPNTEQVTFFTSDAKVKSIIEEREDSLSIDEAILKVIPNNLTFYRSNDTGHTVHTAVSYTHLTLPTICSV